MQFLQMLSLATFSLIVAAVSGRSDSSVTPVQKVLEMLDGMLEKGKAEKHDEMVRFSAFKEWCEQTKDEKGKLIKAGEDKIASLEADITKSEADAAKLGTEIDGHNKDIDTWTGESDSSAAQRKAELKDYQTTHLDYSESIDALERAIQVLKSREKDVPQSLVQVQKLGDLKLLPAQAKHALATFLQASSSAEVGAPEANAYEFQSSSVVDMLEKLRLRFQDERLVLEKEEMNRKAAYQQVMQKLTDDINYAKDQASSKSAAKSQALEDAATAKGDLAETKDAKAADEKYLQDATTECVSKSKDFESRQTLRATELEAIQKAIEIISSPEVSGAATEYLPGTALLQANRKPTALAQLRSGATPDASIKQKVVSLLLQASQEAKSDLLANVANRVGEDPFGKVKKMIKDLITKLMEQANEEADHHEFCDTELANNKAVRDDKSSEVTELTARIDELTAKNAKLTEDIAGLAEAISQLDASVKEATETRAKEKAANLATIADAKAAIAAVTKAIEILNKFYAKAATATALIQAAPDDAPETFDKPYTGMQGESGGVVGMLEVIQSDFTRLEAETSNSEEEAQRDHETFLSDSEQDKAVKEKEKMHMGFDQVRTERALNQNKKDLKATQAELDAALEYYDKLKPQCIDLGLSYEERVAKRKAEIVSLQEALKVLSGEDI